MQILLVILGLIGIVGLVVHGLWTIRKNERVNEKQRQAIERKKRQVDSSGFDEFGIGQVRTIKRSELEENQDASVRTEASMRAKPREPNSTSSSASTPSAASPARQGAGARIETQVPSSLGKEQSPFSAKPTAPTKPAVETPAVTPKTAQPSLFSEEETPAATRATKGRKEPSVEVEQLPMSFDEGPEVGDTDDYMIDPDDDQSHEYVAQEKETLTPEPPKQEVITLYISGDIQGAILLQTVTELGLKFGEMDIFHRHEDTSGHGPILFSLANMYNPGVFDLDHIETFTTRGIALFMTLPLKSDGHKAFTMMYNAANKIAEAMPRAAVLDGNRNPITKQSVQHTYQKIREFERREKLAGSVRT
ncbi:MAG: cell division protein ZipA [Idiomarina sp.]|nr:cell division protein ZipA [Idiomarina sp.]